MSELRRPHKIDCRPDTREYSALSKYIQSSHKRRPLARSIRCLFSLKYFLCFTFNEVWQICSIMELCAHYSKGTHLTLNMIYTHIWYGTKSIYSTNISKLTNCLFIVRKHVTQKPLHIYHSECVYNGYHMVILGCLYSVSCFPFFTVK